MKYCDLYCEYAEFPEKLADGSGTCRTFIALHCKLLDKLVDKNGICQAEPGKERNDGGEVEF